MATTTINLTITTPTGVTIAQAIDYFARNQGYQATFMDGTPNPESEAQFVKRKLSEYLAKAIKEQRRADAALAATQSSDAQPDITVS